MFFNNANYHLQYQSIYENTYATKISAIKYAASNKDAKMGLALRPNYLKLIYKDNIAFGIQSSKNFGSKTIPL